MSDGSAGDEGKTTFTKEELDAAVAERNKALEAKRDELLSEVKAVKDRLKAFDGVDPSEFRSLKTKLVELEQVKKAQEKGISSQDLEKMRVEVRQDLDKEYGPLKSQLEQAQGEVRTLRLDNVVKQQMAEAGVRSKRIDALYRLTADHFDLTDDGQPMVKVRPGTEPVKYVADVLSEEYPEFFEGSGSSGGGASKSVASGSGNVRTVTLGDMDGFMANLEGIASGKVKVAE